MGQESTQIHGEALKMEPILLQSMQADIAARQYTNMTILILCRKQRESMPTQMGKLIFDSLGAPSDCKERTNQSGRVKMIGRQ